MRRGENENKMRQRGNIMANALNEIKNLYDEIKSVLLQARARAYSAVSFAMITAYWSIGQLIVEH